MKNFHPFFIIGTLGTIITAMLHMFFALGLSLSSHATFLILYPAFTTFLFLGVAFTVRKVKA